MSPFSHGGYLTLEQNSSLQVLLDCQEFPEVQCSLTITSWPEVRDEDRGPLAHSDLRNRKGVVVSVEE